MNESHIYELPKNNRLIFDMGKVPELWRKTMVNTFLFRVALKSKPVFRSRKLRKQTFRQEFESAILMFSI